MGAKGGAAIILDAKTGEVLSMANMPTYNPNNREGVSLDALRNRVAIDIYEPGSIIKPLVVAKALNDKIVTPDTVFNTMPYSVGPKLIKDTHDHPRLTVSQIIEKSSDVGASKIGMKYRPKELWSYYNSIGYGERVGTGFPAEARGILRPWQKWYPIDQATMSFGYGVSVSLLQMARAYSMFTNNGCILPVTFYKIADTHNIPCKQIVSPYVSKEVQIMLDQVTEDGGTGKLARVEGYTTAGKTGTAHKLGQHGYAEHNYYGSFVGYAPSRNPRVIVAVMIDDPKIGGYYGGKVAAPIFSSIVGASLPILGVKPDR